MNKRVALIFVVCIFCVSLMGGCGRKQTQEKKDGEASSVSLRDEEPENGKNVSTEVREVTAAIENASNLPSFELDTKARLKLNGTSINDEYNMKSEIHIVQGENRENMQMTMVSSSDIDDIVSKAFYKDGWYYTDDKNGKNKEEKTADEVLKMVSDVTALVTDASEQIDDMQVEEENGSKVYTYHIPAYLAEDYLRKLSKSAAAEDTALENAKSEVEEVWLVSEVDGDGVLTGQELHISGVIRKAIFKVPAKADITAQFSRTEDTKLDMETW